MSSYLLPRPFPYETKRFRNNLRVYAGAVIGLAVAGLLLGRMAAGNITVVYIFMIIAVFVLAYLLVVPFPLLYTTHSVTGDSVMLRQGLGFTLTIPFGNISAIKVKEISARPGLRVDRAEGTLFVLATGTGTVRIMLREPQTVKHGAFDCVVLDVKDPREFVSSVKERRKGEAIMKGLEEENPQKKTAAIPRREPKTLAVEVVEEEPVERPPMKRRLAPREDAPVARQRPVGRMVRVPKSRDD
jgi:hypothetical protein